MNDWIEHDGKSYPNVEKGVIFDLKFRNGEEYTDGKTTPWWLFLHNKEPSGYDIVAYRVHSTPKQQSSE